MTRLEFAALRNTLLELSGTVRGLNLPSLFDLLAAPQPPNWLCDTPDLDRLIRLAIAACAFQGAAQANADRRMGA